jgi:glycosyltransferase involved in cell wall biosynthesis
MHILILNYEFPPLGGGAGNAAYYLLKEFAKGKDLNIDLVTSLVGGYKKEDFSSNIKIYYLDIGKKGSSHFQTQKDLFAYSWRAYWFCKKLISKKRYDLIHAFFGIPCGYIAMKLGLPYIVSLRGSDVPFYNQRFYFWDKFIFKRLSKIIWKKSKYVIANSFGLKQLAKNINPAQKIEVIYNGVDSQEFKPNADKSIGKTIKLISIGRLIPRKGYKYLLKSLKGLSNCELFLVGEGVERENLKTLAKKMGVKVRFYGRVSHQEVVYLLREADIFVLPSLNEGMSNSLLEAVACGLPVIVTDTGGSVELVKGNGIIVPKADVISLRSAIKRFLSDKNSLENMGQKSRQLAESMSWISVAEQYKYFYTKIIRKQN